MDARLGGIGYYNDTLDMYVCDTDALREAFTYEQTATMKFYWLCDFCHSFNRLEKLLYPLGSQRCEMCKTSFTLNPNPLYIDTLTDL